MNETEELEMSLERTNAVVNDITVRLAELQEEFDRTSKSTINIAKDLIRGCSENQKLKEQLEAADEEIRLLTNALIRSGRGRESTAFAVEDVPPETADQDFSKGGFIDRFFELEKARGEAWPEQFEQMIKESYVSPKI